MFDTFLLCVKWLILPSWIRDYDELHSNSRISELKKGWINKDYFSISFRLLFVGGLRLRRVLKYGIIFAKSISCLKCTIDGFGHLSF